MTRISYTEPSLMSLALGPGQSAEPEPLLAKHELSMVEPVVDLGGEDNVVLGAAKVIGRGSILTAAVGVYAYEQSPENEALRGRWAIKALEHANRVLTEVDPRVVSVSGKAAMVGATVSLITVGVEALSGLVTAATMSQKDGLLGRFNGWITKQAKRLETVDKNGKPKGDIALGLAGGASLLVVKREAESEEDRTFKDNAKTALKASAGIAAFSGTVAALTTVAIDTSDIHGHTTEAVWVMDRVSDGKTWWAIYAGGIALNRLNKLHDFTGQKIGAWYYSRGAELARPGPEIN